MKKIFTIFLLSAVSIFPQSLLINEVMTSNASTLADQNGNYPDWLEVFNPGTSGLNLGFYFLSDDFSNLQKWRFPDTIIQSGQYLTVFASGSGSSVSHWETIINWGDVWKYKPGASQPPADWNKIDFFDSGWAGGTSGFGYGDDDDNTILSSVISVFIRKEFMIENVKNIKAAVLHIDYDDAFVAYLNGIEIARANISGNPPPYNQSSITYREASIYSGGFPERFDIANISDLLVEGKNILAIQGHNSGSSSSDMSLIPFFTLGMTEKPNNAKGTPELLRIESAEIHTNFKLDSSGESLYLSDTLGGIIDSVSVIPLQPDYSYGRLLNGNEWRIFDSPSPGFANPAEGYLGQTANPEFSLPGGFYNSTIMLNIHSSSDSSIVYFSTNGSVPTKKSSILAIPVLINKTTVVRAFAQSKGLLPSKVITNTYFINEVKNLSVVSISTDPKNFFDPDSGIYVMGPNAESEFPHFGANFWQDWEKPIHIEYFTENGEPGFDLDAGVKIYGNWSRGLAQKSLAVFARSKYGANKINYKLFEDKNIDSFESIILRNSGNDWGRSMMRDAFMQTLVKNTGIDYQSYKPAVLYINGEYWGIHNLREKISEHYLSSNHNVDPSEITMLENDGNPVTGNNTDYSALFNFISANNLAVSANYDIARSKIDIDEFINYFISQIYFDNTDWPGNNIKFWKADSPLSKWRWILFDTDFGFGIWNPSAYTNNTLQFALEANGPAWPNPPWSTLFLRKLLENGEFKNLFLNRFADFANTIFDAENVRSLIESMKTVIDEEMSFHLNRWGGSKSSWQTDINNMKTFASYRATYMRAHIMNKFNISGLALIWLNLSDTTMGNIKINSLVLSEPTWWGRYFKGVPINVTAIPKPGYNFVRWDGEGIENRTVRSLEINLPGNMNITAVFEPADILINEIVINEINYNSSPDFDTEDWIELYNNSGENVNIGGWIFKDDDDLHEFVIPTGTLLNADDYLILCRDTIKFKVGFPEAKNIFGNFDFGLSSNGELIRLYDYNMNLIDSVAYGSASPWPGEANGQGHTLSLLNPSLDNSRSENWDASRGIGTPCKINDTFTSAEISSQNLPTKFELYQNYPNPFNPSTIIKFQVASSKFIKLHVFDILGREIQTLVNEQKPPGNYEIEFSAVGLPSGVYFYRIKTENYNATKKMVLLR
ncbi:MAG: CotH kinase family protein [Bacteroidetes bacterium]|nr:CotH kinase family protein [Bacteroidota bacterium]